MNRVSPFLEVDGFLLSSSPLPTDGRLVVAVLLLLEGLYGGNFLLEGRFVVSLCFVVTFSFGFSVNRSKARLRVLASVEDGLTRVLDVFDFRSRYLSQKERVELAGEGFVVFETWSGVAVSRNDGRTDAFGRRFCPGLRGLGVLIRGIRVVVVRCSVNLSVVLEEDRGRGVGGRSLGGRPVITGRLLIVGVIAIVGRVLVVGRLVVRRSVVGRLVVVGSLLYMGRLVVVRRSVMGRLVVIGRLLVV